ncbi:hypothetical protein LTR97_009398 [Elasticomyces elasticus]|uniref:Uncharacterized protein n=1 Tax=Elasticomyces elasticus TaxID=574655 RepID=A0AAN7W3J3_9PEZI|nr:hypothetical protein LTR97_009398 [Elasticomyces elasticus]KAK5728554.1 hypothetical protein LTR15_001691 [Elasticomyces elasticus]
MDVGAYIQRAILNDYSELQRRHVASKVTRSGNTADPEATAIVQQTALLGRVRSNVWRGAEDGKREQVLRAREELRQLYIKTFRDPEGLDAAVYLVQRNRIAELEGHLENSQMQHRKAMDTAAATFIDRETALKREHEDKLSALRAENERELETFQDQHQMALDQASNEILSLKEASSATIMELWEEQMKRARLLLKQNDSPDFIKTCHAAALRQADRRIAEFKNQTNDLLVQLSTCSTAEAVAKLQQDLYRTRFQVKLHKNMKKLVGEDVGAGLRAQCGD